MARLLGYKLNKSTCEEYLKVGHDYESARDELGDSLEMLLGELNPPDNQASKSRNKDSFPKDDDSKKPSAPKSPWRRRRARTRGVKLNLSSSTASFFLTDKFNSDPSFVGESDPTAAFFGPISKDEKMDDEVYINVADYHTRLGPLRCVR